MRRASSGGRRRRSVAALVAGAALGLAGIAWAAFSNATSNPASTFTAKRIFPGDRSTSVWNIRDASGGGAEADKSDKLSFFNDILKEGTNDWATTFATNRYLDVDFDGPLPAGLSVSGATFNFSFLPKKSTSTACYYFDVRRASTGAVLGTYGSSGSPLQCVTGTAYTQSSTAIPAVTDTGIANDLRIRVYVKTSVVDRIEVDVATVTGSTPYVSFALYEKLRVDAADTIPVTSPWSIYTGGDAVQYQSSLWATTFSSTRYIRLVYPPYVPTSAIVTSATFTHAYRSQNAGVETCYYIEAYNGSTLIGTHGSGASPISCNTSNTTWVTDTVALPEVDTATEANNLVIRIYAKNATSTSSQHDYARLTLNYYLN